MMYDAGFPSSLSFARKSTVDDAFCWKLSNRTHAENVIPRLGTWETLHAWRPFRNRHEAGVTEVEGVTTALELDPAAVVFFNEGGGANHGRIARGVGRIVLLLLADVFRSIIFACERPPKARRVLQRWRHGWASRW